MSYLNAESAGMNVYLWSLGPSSMGADYHKILGSVKTGGGTAISWGSGKIYGIAEMTKCKLSHRFGGSLDNNDKGKKGPWNHTEVLRGPLLDRKSEQSHLERR